MSGGPTGHRLAEDPRGALLQMVAIDQLKPPGGEVALFQGADYGAQVSFFVVQFSPGQGPRQHRHPYEETFILLDGEIEVYLESGTLKVGSGTIVVVPANTWHSFLNCGARPCQMVNLHPVPKMITEWA